MKTFKRRLRQSNEGPASGVLFTKAENVAVRILDAKIEACPWSFFKRLDHLSPTHFQLAEQTSDARHGNIRVQMFVLFPVFSVRGQFRRTLEMHRESVTRNARVERLIIKIELEAKLVTVIRNCSVKIIDKKLRGYPSKVRSTLNCHSGRFIPRLLVARRTERSRQDRRSRSRAGRRVYPQAVR